MSTPIDIALQELTADYETKRKALLAQQRKATEIAQTNAKLEQSKVESSEKQKAISEALAAFRETDQALFMVDMESLAGECQQIRAAYAEIQRLITFVSETHNPVRTRLNLRIGTFWKARQALPDQPSEDVVKDETRELLGDLDFAVAVPVGLKTFLKEKGIQYNIGLPQ